MTVYMYIQYTDEQNIGLDNHQMMFQSTIDDQWRTKLSAGKLLVVGRNWYDDCVDHPVKELIRTADANDNVCVLSGDENFIPKTVKVYSGLDEIIRDNPDKDIMLLGGCETFMSCFEYTDVIYTSTPDALVPGNIRMSIRKATAEWEKHTLETSIVGDIYYPKGTMRPVTGMEEKNHYRGRLFLDEYRKSKFIKETEDVCQKPAVTIKLKIKQWGHATRKFLQWRRWTKRN